MSGTVLITGATAGIGYALAECFAKDGHDLVLVARREDRLIEVAKDFHEKHGVEASVRVGDLSEPETPGRLYDALREDGVQIDYLVNNAGFGLSGPFADTDLAIEQEMIQVNCKAYVHLTKLFLGDFVKRGRGGILNVASTGGFLPCPSFSVYCATKAFILSFTEALAHELKGTGVKALALCPGAVKTEFQARANTDGINLGNAPLMKFMAPEPVAREGYRAFMRGQAVSVPGWANKMLAQSGRIFPRKVVASIAAGAMEPVE